MSFQIGDEVILTRKHKLEEFVQMDDYTPQEFFYDRDLAFVVSINNDGSVQKYCYGTFWTDDENSESYELDHAVPNYDDIHTWNPSEHDNREGWTWVTLQMLKDLKIANNGTLDSICRKVIQLYRKHNNNHGSAYQFKGV